MLQNDISPGQVHACSMGGRTTGRGGDGLGWTRAEGGEGLGWTGAVGEDEGGEVMPPGTDPVIRGNGKKDGTPPLPGNIPPDNGAIGDVLDTEEGSEIKIGKVEERAAA